MTLEKLEKELKASSLEEENGILPVSFDLGKPASESDTKYGVEPLPKDELSRTTRLRKV